MNVTSFENQWPEGWTVIHTLRAGPLSVTKQLLLLVRESHVMVSGCLLSAGLSKTAILTSLL